MSIKCSDNIYEGKILRGVVAPGVVLTQAYIMRDLQKGNPERNKGRGKKAIRQSET